MSESVGALLRRHGLHLSRDLGQNYLTDPGIADRLAALAGVAPGDTVIEIGTGLGALTRALAARAERVITIEIDAGVVRCLQAEEMLPENAELLHADALALDLAEFIPSDGAPVRLVANLPYSAATPLLRRLLDLRDRFEDWSVMVQREMARRVVAGPGSRDYGSFAVIHKLCVDVAVQLELGPGAFFPEPKVRSSFLRVWPRTTPLLEEGELPWVERVIRAAFASRRKTILNCLRAGGFVSRDDRDVLDAALVAADIDPALRAEAVPPEQLLALARALRASSSA